MCKKDITINYDDSIRLIKKRCVLKQIESEHGLEGLRIINLLLDLNALEEKEVGDLAMLDPRAVRAKLYALFRCGYLIVEEASRRSDMNPTYSYYIYRAEMKQMEGVVSRSVLKALLNLRIVKRKYIDESKRFEEVKRQVDRYHSRQISFRELKEVQDFNQYVRLQFFIEHLDRCIENIDKTCVLLTSIKEADIKLN